MRRFTPEDVTIGISARERDSLAAETITRLRTNTPPGPRILYVDSDTSLKYKPGIERSLNQFGPHSILIFDEYLLPIQATNRIIASCQTPILTLLENDVQIPQDWLDPVLEAINDGADFVSPEIMEAHQYPITPQTRLVYHFNPEISEFVDQEDGSVLNNVKRVPSKDVDVSKRRPISHMERHAFFGRTEVFQAIFPFPEFLNTREQILISLTIYKSGMGIMMVPDCSVTYVELPLQEEEIPHYLQRWDIDRAEQSNRYVEQAFNIADYRSSMPQVRGRIARAEALRGSVH